MPTEMIDGARSRITLPQPQPLGGGVLSVARVIDASPHELMGVETETEACAEAISWLHNFCTFSSEWLKTFDGAPEAVVGDPFAVYAGVECIRPLAENRERAERRLAYGEDRAVGHVLVSEYLDSAATPIAVDLGGPYPVNQAIGVAEAFAATVYGGVPTILMPRQFVACECCGHLSPNLDGTLTSRLGTRVGTYVLEDPSVPLADTGTLFVTGQLILLRGPVNSYSVPQVVNDDGTFHPMRALAERIYVPVFDCLVAKVEVSCSEPATP